jgi:hypothetical protein
MRNVPYVSAVGAASSSPSSSTSEIAGLMSRLLAAAVGRVPVSRYDTTRLLCSLPQRYFVASHAFGGGVCSALDRVEQRSAGACMQTVANRCMWGIGRPDAEEQQGHLAYQAQTILQAWDSWCLIKGSTIQSYCLNWSCRKSWSQVQMQVAELPLNLVALEDPPLLILVT